MGKFTGIGGGRGGGVGVLCHGIEHYSKVLCILMPLQGNPKTIMYFLSLCINIRVEIQKSELKI